VDPTDLPETIRAFAAIHLPEELLANIRALQARLQSDFPKDAVRWTAPEQLHLTLKFLGNIPRRSLGQLKAELARICQGLPPLLLRLEGLGCFPTPPKPRVLWVGLAGDIPQLQTLQSQINAAMQPWCERNEERAFRPHLTIGRLREASPRNARQIGDNIKAAAISALGEWNAAQVHLMRSQLSPAGATHTVLASLPLLGVA
jgi:2'-5' RNA ligase